MCRAGPLNRRWRRLVPGLSGGCECYFDLPLQHSDLGAARLGTYVAHGADPLTRRSRGGHCERTIGILGYREARLTSIQVDMPLRSRPCDAGPGVGVEKDD